MFPPREQGSISTSPLLDRNQFNRESGENDDDDDTPPPTSTAQFPEVTTWTDQQLITAVELADRREPALRLQATADMADRYDALLDECSAELVRRLQARGVRLSA
jgi:hypothetical protein